MDKLKYIKLENEDGTYSNSIAISAEAKNVSTEDGLSVEYKLAKKPYYFDTVADMKTAACLVAGDYVITEGYYSANDGGGATYKIRTKTNEDTPNDVDLIAIGITLVGELIQNYFITSEKYLFIGDSYMYGSTPQGQITSYVTYLKNRMGLSNDDAYIYCMPGAGFTVGSVSFGNKKFIDLLNQAISDINAIDKALIKNIYVIGGYNDRVTSYSNILTAMATFSNTCKSNFPNAKIYVGMIGNDNNNSVDGRTARYNVFTNSLEAYKLCNTMNMIYLTNSERIMHDYTLFASDGIHPNDLGQQKLGAGLFNIIENYGYTNKTNYHAITFTTPNFTDASSYTIDEVLIENNVHLRISSAILTLNSSIENNPSLFTQIDLGTINSSFIRNKFNRPLGNINVRIFDTNSNYYYMNCSVMINDSGHLVLQFLSNLSDTTILFNKVQIYQESINIPLDLC